MTIDHIGAILYPEITVLRLIGRISFPIFSYLLILGMENTRDIRKYFIRLFVFAIISQIPFFLSLGITPFERLNIFFTLSFGLIFIYYFKKSSIIALFPLLISYILPFDFSIYGIAMIGCLYFLNQNIKIGSTLFVLLNILFLLPWNPQFLSVIALPFIVLHKNGFISLIKKWPSLSLVIWAWILEMDLSLIMMPHSGCLPMTSLWDESTYCLPSGRPWMITRQALIFFASSS